MKLHKWIPPVQIHPILIVFLLISFVTGTFMELSIILAIVLFHELGHFAVARIFNWRIQRIMLWIFGGVMDTDEHGNKPLYQEALVIIAGPFQHIIVYFFVLMISSFHILLPSVVELILFYNTVLLVFNLLPIWPLDGGKLLFIALSRFLPYKKAYSTVIISSVTTILLIIIIQLFQLPFTLSALLVMLFLLAENRTEWKQRYYVFIRFLFKRSTNAMTERSPQPITISHEATLMDVFAQFKREKIHHIYITYPNNILKSIGEKECLRSFFYDRQYDKSIGELANHVT